MRQNLVLAIIWGFSIAMWLMIINFVTHHVSIVLH